MRARLEFGECVIEPRSADFGRAGGVAGLDTDRVRRPRGFEDFLIGELE